MRLEVWSGNYRSCGGVVIPSHEGVANVINHGTIVHKICMDDMHGA